MPIGYALLRAQGLECLQHELTGFGTQLVGGSFRQNADKGLGTAGAQQNTAALAKELFKHACVVHSRFLVGNAHVGEQLRVQFHRRAQLG